MAQIEASDVLYIKLGEGGTWEADCIRNGTLRLGYEDYPHDLCSQGRWDEVLAKALAQKLTKNRGAATRAVNQVRLFYEAPQTTLWTTFYGNSLWWCFAAHNVKLDSDGTRLRQTMDGWHSKDVKGELLLKARLSGRLLAIQQFMGTICSVPERSYVLHKINGTDSPHIASAQTALENLQKALLPLIRNLSPKDFEIFTDLIFRQAGWQRTGVVGGTHGRNALPHTE